MNKTDLANYEYGRGPTVKEILWYFFNVVFFLNRFNTSSGLKVFLLRFFDGKIGRGVNIKPGVNIKYPWNLEIGDYVWIGENVWIDNLAKVKIGSNSCLSQGSMLLTGNHDYKSRRFDLVTKSIELEEGVWIGAKAVVCPGIKCLSHSVLTVGSVANQNLEAYSVYQGNPAKFLRKRMAE